MQAQATKEKKLGPPRSSAWIRWICKVYLKIAGWEIEGELPQAPKMVLIFAPHTSNWDGFYMIPAALAFGLRPNFLGKKELFWGPLGPFMRWLGGIPVDRKVKMDLVTQMAEAIEARDQVVLGIAPEGTRSRKDYWKSGFYHIALKAGVPLSFGYLDYQRKCAGFDKGIELSGDVDKDLALIRQFFAKIPAKYPEKVGKVAFRPQT